MRTRHAHRMIFALAAVALAAVALVACDAAEDVDVQPLPSLTSTSPEARAGLPEIAGHWRFAGWELEEGDTGRVAAELPRFGEILLETQRLDSIAGVYVAGGGRMPLIGEVRRDGIVALVGGGRYLTGRYQRDTLWLGLTSLVEPGGWPGDGRAAFVRAQVASAFVRVRGAIPTLAAADSLAGDSILGAQQLGQPGALQPGAAQPRAEVPPARGAGERRPAVGGAEPRVTPPVTAPAERTPPVTEPTPAEPREAEPEREPEPEPETEPRPRRQPRLLGVPVDSARDR